MTYALVIHGGAGAHPALDYSLQSQHLADLIAEGQAMLTAGMSALETVAEMVQAMEASGLYVAGKGSAPNRDGVIELDASIMDGATRRAGAIAGLYHTLVLADVPALGPEKRNEAARFVTLIDALYEHKVKLVCSAAVAPDALYPKGDGSAAFERTVSRLYEMQSDAYLVAPHPT